MPKWERFLSIGLLFLSFSLTLFNLSSLGLAAKAAAVGSFIISTLFLICIIVDSLLPSIEQSATRQTRADGWGNFAAKLWEALRLFMILAFIVLFVLSLGKGTAEMKWNPLGRSVVVVGVTWFFVICAAFLATLMPQGKLTRLGKVLYAILSLGIMVYGIAQVLWDRQHLLNAVFLVIFGLTVAVAAIARQRLSRYAPF
jgi:hypothetical protein